jgi:hypothetical protein
VNKTIILVVGRRVSTEKSEKTAFLLKSVTGHGGCGEDKMQKGSEPRSASIRRRMCGVTGSFADGNRPPVVAVDPVGQGSTTGAGGCGRGGNEQGDHGGGRQEKVVEAQAGAGNQVNRPYRRVPIQQTEIDKDYLFCISWWMHQ